MIVSRIMGGLGNQLFCYAAARRLSLVSETELVIDDVSGFAYDNTYQRKCQLDHFNIPCRKATSMERLEPCSRVRRYLKRAINHLRPFGGRSYIQQESVEFDSRLLDVRLNGRSIYLEGYWQSELYFKDIEDVIRRDLQITPPRDSQNLVMALKIRNCTSVAVHVRFFDALNELVASNSNVPSNYYARAIAKMDSIVPDAHYFIFSDQAADACSLVPLSTERFTVVDHNEGDKSAYADLWLMTQCQHFIIANSTFSWWGAWLAHYCDKCVIAPDLEIREGKMSWGFDGLLPDEWLKL